MPEPVLCIENLSKSFLEPGGGRLPVLDIARLEVAAGEQVVIRGESGGGKTTLLHAIAGITQVDSGAIRIAGADITKLPEAARDLFRARYIGYVFQTFNLLAGFSALENVVLGMTFTNQPTDAGRARELLVKVGLGDRLAFKPHSLSVGQQQRVAVARALANRPKLMLADEPTANIDPAHQQQVIDTMRAACRDEQIALLWVTHSDEVAGQFERVLHMETFNHATAAAP